MSGKGFRIEPVQQEDVPALAEMAESAFEDDRHTNMKNLAQEPFDMKSYTLSSMPTLLKRPICILIKAVDEETGAIMGVCNWGFRGVKAADMPKVEGRIQPPDEPPKEPAPEPTPEEIEAEEKAAAAETDPVKRLVRLTNKDMEDFMKKTMPPGTRCMFIIGLTVDPKYQGRGVGSALLKWGTNVCDEMGLFAWVHSSAGAWKMYEKCGFEIVQTLKVDLDEYAPCKPPNEGPDAKWGEYVFRYMKYFGKSTK